ncbi:hypothetical protein [Luteimonas sp. 3794]|uniref:hypothetical protein n=1 Tax=Luteimonas sp. 3794 TaxID=2817730 RepID=UPI00285A3ED4|nr:hypothetical protein [Luteimonas sp. 3794]MDR6990206.1 hypothetical protein [Luteimonas sp. 3794]
MATEDLQIERDTSDGSGATMPARREASVVSSAHVVAWISVVLAFGTTQGVIYLKSFWGRFGLDPFQFSNAGDLAVVGLTGIGVTLAFMAGAALLGGYLGAALVQHVPKSRLACWSIFGGLLCSLVVLVIFVDFGIYLLFGMVLTWFLIWLAHHSPDIPETFKHAKVIGYVALAIAYIPMASHYYGQRKANSILVEERVLVLSPERLRDTALPAGEQRFVGRLGGEYVFYAPTDRTTTIVQAGAVDRMTLRVKRPETPDRSNE